MGTKEQLTRRQQMETGILLALVLLGFSFYLKDWTLVVIGEVVLLISLVLPIVFYPLAFLWFGLARILSFLTSNLLFCLLFFVLITPVGIVRKWLGKDTFLLRQFKKNDDSVLRSRDQKIKAEHLQHPF